jgi:hypothetical protein
VGRAPPAQKAITRRAPRVVAFRRDGIDRCNCSNRWNRARGSSVVRRSRAAMPPKASSEARATLARRREIVHPPAAWGRASRAVESDDRVEAELVDESAALPGGAARSGDAVRSVVE